MRGKRRCSSNAANLADVLERASSRLESMAPETAEDSSPAAPPPVASGASPSPPVTPSRPVTPQAVSAQRRGPNLSDRVTERFTDSTSAREGTVSRFKRRATSTKADRPAHSGSTEGLRLLATQMAVAGSTHEEIALRLREEFGVEDASELLGEAPIARKVRESDGSG